MVASVSVKVEKYAPSAVGTTVLATTTGVLTLITMLPAPNAGSLLETWSTKAEPAGRPEAVTVLGPTQSKFGWTFV